VAIVRAELAAAGRDPDRFRIAKRVYISVDDDQARAVAALEDGLQQLYGSPIPVEVGIAGAPAACSEQLADVIDAGAGLVQLNPVHDDLEQMRRLASEVIPRLA